MWSDSRLFSPPIWRGESERHQTDGEALKVTNCSTFFSIPKPHPILHPCIDRGRVLSIDLMYVEVEKEQSHNALLSFWLLASKSRQSHFVSVISSLRSSNAALKELGSSIIQFPGAQGLPSLQVPWVTMMLACWMLLYDARPVPHVNRQRHV